MAGFHVIGVMSGTSLDGLDLSYAHIFRERNKWRYELLQARTLAYPEKLQVRLARAIDMSGLELSRLHADYGHFVGKSLKRFIQSNRISPDFAAVHGHTVFHQPRKGFGLQIGDGAAMAAESGITIVNDFRATDLALGGQGAPLVPVGDELLFSEYDFCLNLGGISNISYREKTRKRIAFDISPCNMALNFYAGRLGMKYDADGLLARSGCLLPTLKERLDALPYYAAIPPKSLGFEWFHDQFLPVTEQFASQASVQDILHTITEHIATQIARTCRQAKTKTKPGKKKTLLMTGGGALNIYLRERIEALCGMKAAAVDKKLVDYKESLIFAFLGVLRMQRRPNCLCSVTGARRDNIGGAVYLP